MAGFVRVKGRMVNFDEVVLVKEVTVWRSFGPAVIIFMPGFMDDPIVVDKERWSVDYSALCEMINECPSIASVVDRQKSDNEQARQQKEAHDAFINSFMASGFSVHFSSEPGGEEEELEVHVDAEGNERPTLESVLADQIDSTVWLIRENVASLSTAAEHKLRGYIKRLADTVVSFTLNSHVKEN